jgi:hypothetical protein
MGDAADYWTEQGEAAYFAHLAGQCDDFCIYCAEEDDAEDPVTFDW